MLEKMYCPICNSEIVLRYHIPDKNFKITDGKITRDDAHKGQFFDDPELNFECSNDRGHNIYNLSYSNVNDELENTIRKKFYIGAYYDK